MMIPIMMMIVNKDVAMVGVAVIVPTLVVPQMSTIDNTINRWFFNASPSYRLNERLK